MGNKKGKGDTPNLNSLIQEVLDEKAQDVALRNQVRAAVEGVDPADISKASYAHWLATILPRIRDVDFDYFTYENTKLTLSYLNRARLNLPPADPSLRGQLLVNTQPRGPKMSTTDSLTVTAPTATSSKPATQSVPPPDISREDVQDAQESTLPDLPAPSVRPDLQPKPGTSTEPQPSTSRQPLPHPARQIPDGNYATILNYPHQVYSNMSNYIPMCGNIVAVKGSVSPQYLQSQNNSEAQAPTYSELTPVRLERIQPSQQEQWNTVGPPAPAAVQQETPETPLFERLSRIVRECQDVALDLTPSPRKPPIDRTPLQDEPEDPGN